MTSGVVVECVCVFSGPFPVAGSSGLYLVCRETETLRAGVSGRRGGARASGGAQAADVGPSGGAAQLHARRWRRPSVLLAAVCSGLIRLSTFFSLQPPQACGPQRRA